MLGKLTGEDEADGSLNLSGRDGGLLVVRGQLGGLGSDALEDVYVIRVRTCEMGSMKMGQDIPLTKEFRMDMARLEIPVSG